jgi:hypothetical protein
MWKKEFQMNNRLNKVFSNIVKCSILTLSIALCGQLVAQTSKQSYETIDVVGEKTSPQLRREFDKLRFEFLELYNSINDVAKFDVICKYHKPIGSQIARKNCEPRYVKEFRAMMTQTSSTGPGIDFNRLPSDDHIRFLTNDKREEAFEHVAALIATHPELFDSFTKLDAIHQRIELRKENN